MVAIFLADNLLQDDRHLLLINDIACGSHIGLGVTIINRGIDGLDGTSQHTQHFILVFKIRNHISRVDTCERLVVTVFQ